MSPGKNGPGNITPPATQTQQQVTPPAQRANPAGPVPNSPFEFHGQVWERYRDDNNRDNGNRSRQSSETYANTTVTYNASRLFSAYARFALVMDTPRGLGRDFNANFYQGDEGFRGAGALDQFGIIYHDVPHGLSVQVGRQDELLDVSGTLYDQSWRVGLHSFMDGVAVVKKIGAGTVQGYAFSEDQYKPDKTLGVTRPTRNGLYALRSTYNAGKIATFGVLYARFVASNRDRENGILSTNNYEADVVSHFGPLQLTAEYAMSDAKSRRDLSYFGGKLTITPRDSATIFNYRIGDNADVGQDSAYPSGSIGTRTFFEHYFTPRLEIIPYYETDRQIYGPGRSTSTWVTLQYTY